MKIIVLYVCHVSVLIAALPRESLVQNLRKWMTKLQKEFPIQSAELQEQLAVLQEQTAQKFPEMKDAVGLLKGINLEEE